MRCTFALAALFCVATHITWTARPPPQSAPISLPWMVSTPGRSLLEMRQCGAVWKAGRAKDLATAGGELAPQQLAELRRTAGLYLHQGIGAEYGNLLLRAGIRSVEDLGQLSAETVLQKLDAAPHQRLPTLAQVRVWMRRAPRERNIQ